MFLTLLVALLACHLGVEIVAADEDTCVDQRTRSHGSTFLQSPRAQALRRTNATSATAMMKDVTTGSGACAPCECPNSLLEERVEDTSAVGVKGKAKASKFIATASWAMNFGKMAISAGASNPVSALANIAGIGSAFGLFGGGGMSNEELADKMTEEIKKQTEVLKEEHEETRKLMNLNHEEVMEELEEQGRATRSQIRRLSADAKRHHQEMMDFVQGESFQTHYRQCLEYMTDIKSKYELFGVLQENIEERLGKTCAECPCQRVSAPPSRAHKEVEFFQSLGSGAADAYQRFYSCAMPTSFSNGLLDSFLEADPTSETSETGYRNRLMALQLAREIMETLLIGVQMLMHEMAVLEGLPLNLLVEMAESEAAKCERVWAHIWSLINIPQNTHKEAVVVQMYTQAALANLTSAACTPPARRCRGCDVNSSMVLKIQNTYTSDWAAGITKATRLCVGNPRCHEFEIRVDMGQMYLSMGGGSGCGPHERDPVQWSSQEGAGYIIWRQPMYELGTTTSTTLLPPPDSMHTFQVDEGPCVRLGSGCVQSFGYPETSYHSPQTCKISAPGASGLRLVTQDLNLPVSCGYGFCATLGTLQAWKADGTIVENTYIPESSDMSGRIEWSQTARSDQLGRGWVVCPLFHKVRLHVFACRKVGQSPKVSQVKFAWIRQMMRGNITLDVPAGTSMSPLEHTFPEPKAIDAFSYVTNSDAPESDPVQWRLEGFDGSKWIFLTERLGNFIPLEERQTETPWFEFSRIPVAE